MSRVRDLEGDTKSWPNFENPLQGFSPEAFDAEFEGKRSILYGVLKCNRPFVDLLTYLTLTSIVLLLLINSLLTSYFGSSIIFITNCTVELIC